MEGCVGVRGKGGGERGGVLLLRGWDVLRGNLLCRGLLLRGGYLLRGRLLLRGGVLLWGGLLLRGVVLLWGVEAERGVVRGVGCCRVWLGEGRLHGRVGERGGSVKP